MSLGVNQLIGFGAGGGPTFPVLAADFDGTNDSMLRGAGLTGAADSARGIFSIWLRLDGKDGEYRTFIYGEGGSTDSQMYIDTSNKLHFSFVNTARTAYLVFNSLSALTAATGGHWMHLIASWDIGVKTAQFYLDGVNNFSSVSDGATNLDYTFSDVAIGADAVTAGSKMDGAFAEYYFNFGETIDLSVAANLQKWRSPSGVPVDLGSDGSTPTGTAPIIYQSLRPGDAATVFATNRGSGGNFSITGSLDIASSSPSDSAGAPVTFAYTATSAIESIGTSFTFSGVALGTAASNRKIIVGTGSQESVDTTHINTLTVGGVSATELVAINDDAGVDHQAEIWIATVPTGTTGDIVVTTNGNNSSMSIGVWAVYGASSTAHDTVKSIADPQTGTINVPAGGVVIAVAFDRGAGSDYVWTDPTKDFFVTIHTHIRHSGASIAYASIQTGLTVTANLATEAAVQPVMVGVSLAPG